MNHPTVYRRDAPPVPRLGPLLGRGKGVHISGDDPSVCLDATPLRKKTVARRITLADEARQFVRLGRQEPAGR
eukprot:CAMPEP_0194316040 /NCGR_PEP_ID=MMETSP0171-20130528/12860_1 /TAXON_ID=218684 /ORGANISM="Corethron pennatum, Strain L29A3" /LENGTH=72 /DNA_ID=CAMNT_0039072135 /DNA_START=476 /DNA_END=691 /DNA_ORIENTATION=+